MLSAEDIALCNMLYLRRIAICIMLSTEDSHFQICLLSLKYNYFQKCYLRKIAICGLIFAEDNNLQMCYTYRRKQFICKCALYGRYQFANLLSTEDSYLQLYGRYQFVN